MVVADYEITIDGELAVELAAVFAPHDVTVSGGTTMISAEQLDQAALLAILARARDLALSIVRVERTTPRPGSRITARSPQ